MQFFLADYIHPQKLMGYSNDIVKINTNLGYMKTLSDAIRNKKRSSPGQPFTLINVAGRWLIVYTENGIDDTNNMMYFTDFRTELDDSVISKIVPANVLANMKVMQFRYDEVYKESMDIFEVSYWHHGEQILRRNLVTCDDDDIVLAKANELGALVTLQTLNEPETLKVILVDEKIQEDDLLTVNSYAMIHFGKTEKEESGFAYLKIYDLLNNFDLAEDFLNTLEKLGGKFDRVFFMEKFKPERWN
jgi:hypothetical protein